MLNLILITTVAICQLVIVILPFQGKISDKRFNGLKRYTKLGYALILAGILTVILTSWLYFNSEREEEAQKIKLKSELKIRDSINQEKLKKSQNETIEMLAKYGLKVDEYENRIIKIVQDSAKQTTKIYNSVDPFLYVGNISVDKKGDSLKITHSFESKEATSYDIRVQCDILGVSKDFITVTYLVKDEKVFSSKYNMPTSSKSVGTGTLINKTQYPKYAFYYRGKYKKFDGKELIVNKILIYDMNDKSVIEPNDIIAKKILEKISN